LHSIKQLKLNNMKNYIILITFCVGSFAWANFFPINEKNDMLLGLLVFSLLSFALLIMLAITDFIEYRKNKKKQDRTF
jgi:hypothetical protein